jgi:predicted Zn-dependent protease
MTPKNQDDLAHAQLELKRAYLMLEAGDHDAATACCERAVALAPDHPTPTLMRGSILCAMGQARAALGVLRSARKRWPDEALTHVHFAEACLFAGRGSRAASALADARACPNADEHAELISSMEAFWREAGQLE